MWIVKYEVKSGDEAYLKIIDGICLDSHMTDPTNKYDRSH